MYTFSPSGLNWTDLTAPECALKSKHCPVILGTQILTDLSLEALAMTSPDGAYVTSETASLCPRNLQALTDSFRFHNIILLSLTVICVRSLYNATVT